MSGTTRALTPARRDAGLRRLRALNRILIGAAVIATGLLADVAAKAFPGHRRAVRSAAPAQPASAHTPARHRPHHVRHRRHAARPALRAPAQAPAATAAPPATSAAPQPPTATQAAPAPAPAPVVSGGS
jgi:hypothetical protein